MGVCVCVSVALVVLTFFRHTGNHKTEAINLVVKFLEFEFLRGAHEKRKFVCLYRVPLATGCGKL